MLLNTVALKDKGLSGRRKEKKKETGAASLCVPEIITKERRKEKREIRHQQVSKPIDIVSCD